MNWLEYICGLLWLHYERKCHWVNEQLADERGDLWEGIEHRKKKRDVEREIEQARHDRWMAKAPRLAV